jgi:hypothetical protein
VSHVRLIWWAFGSDLGLPSHLLFQVSYNNIVKELSDRTLYLCTNLHFKNLTFIVCTWISLIHSCI